MSQGLFYLNLYQPFQACSFPIPLARVKNTILHSVNKDRVLIVILVFFNLHSISTSQYVSSDDFLNASGISAFISIDTYL